MTDIQKAFCRELLKRAYSHGFDSYEPLVEIAKELNVADILYDENTESGLLWQLGPHGEGLLDFSHDGQYASVNYDMKELCEHWSDYKGRYL